LEALKMKFKKALVEPFKNFISTMKNFKDDSAFILTLLGVLTFIFIPTFIPISLMLLFDAENFGSLALTSVFGFLWAMYSYKVVMAWCETS